MNLADLATKKAYNYYLQYLKTQNLPLATINRKLSSLRRFQEWVIKHYLKTTSKKIEQTRSKPTIIPAWLLYGLTSLIISLLVFLLLSPQLQPASVTPQIQLVKEPSSSEDWLIEFQAQFDSLPQGQDEVQAIFSIFNQESGGQALWSSKTWELAPDQSGLYSVTLGDTAQNDPRLPADLFFQNQDLFLEATVNRQTLSPRFRISTAANSANAFLLQKYPPQIEAGPLTVPVLNSSGSLILAAAAPKVKATNGTLSIEGQAITIQTPFASDGDITLAPDGSGTVNFNLTNSADNSLSITNANLNQDSLIYGYLGNDNTAPNLLRLTAGSTEADVFTVQAGGNATLSGDLTVKGGDVTGANSVSLDLGETNSGYVISSAGLAVGGATTYRFDGSGNIYALDGHFADDLYVTNDFEAKGQITLGDGGETVTINGSTVTLTSLNSCALETNSSGVITCGGSGSLSSLWSEANGTLYPKNSTEDVLIGGTATTSAKFAFINVNSGTPTASISGSVAGNALSLTGDGTITTSLNRSLLLNPSGGNVGIGTTSPIGALDVKDSNARTGIHPTVLTMYVTGALQPGVPSQQGNIEFRHYNGTQGIGFGYNTIYATGSNTNQDLGLDSKGTGNLLFSINDVEKMRLDSGGNLGIGDTSPDAKLEVLATTEQLRLTNVDDTTDARFTVSATGDLTIDMLGSGTTDQLVLGDTDTLNIGSGTASDVAYNLIADAADAKDEAAIAADNDLYIGGDLEVDGTIYGTFAGTIPWSEIDNPTGNLSLSMGAYTTAFNWATGTGANNLFSFTTDASSNGTGSLVNIQTGTSSTVNPLRVRAGTTEGLFVESSGEVGIGTTSPQSLLHLAADTSAGIDVLGETVGSVTGERTNFKGQRARGSLGALTIVSNGDALVGLTGTGYDSSNYIVAGRIGVEVDGVPGVNDMPGRLIFLTTPDGAASAIERMRIDNSGNVGIGTTAPDARLEINHATGDNLRLTYNDADGTAANYTDFSLDSTGGLTLTGSAASVASGASAEKTFLTLTPATITLTGITQVTSLMDTYLLNRATIAGDTATVTVDDAATLTVAGPPAEGTNVSLTEAYGLKINTAATTATSAYGLYVDAPTGAGSNYGAIFASGNVGIGTTTPNSRLEVSGSTNEAITIGNNPWQLRSSAGNFAIQEGVGGTWRLTALAGGNVGIGDTGPDAKLEVLGTTEQLRLTNVDGTTDARFTVSATGDLTVDMLGSGTTDQLVLGDTDILNIGGSGSTDVAYNVIGDSTAGASNVDSDDDLYIEGNLEVDGTIYGTVVGTVPWSEIDAPTADLTLAHSTWNTVFNWVPVADTAETNFSLTTQGADAVAGGEVDQVLLALSQASNGVDTDQAADSLLTLANNDLNDPVTSAIRFDAGAAGTDFTYGINFDAASIGTAELILSNSATIGNTVDGTLALTEPTIQLVGSTAIDIDSPTIDLSTQTVDVTLNNAVDALNFDSNTLSIDALNGRIGVGNTSPGTTLDITGTIRQTSADFTSGLTLKDNTSSSNRSPNLTFTDNAASPLSIYLRKEGNALEMIGTDGSTVRFLAGADGTNVSYFNGGNVGIGDTTPDAKLEVLATTEQLRLTHTDGTADAKFTVDSGGDLTIAPTGGDVVLTADLAVNGATSADITSTTTTASLFNSTVTTLNIGGAATTNMNALTLSGHLTLSSDANEGASGGGLVDCDTAATSKLMWDITTNKFSCGSDQGGSSAATKWSAITDPDTNLSLAHNGFTTTFGWIATGTLSPWTMNLTNNAAAPTTQRFVNISNLQTSQTGDVNTESLLRLDNGDTITLGSTIVDDAILVTNSGGIIDGVTDALDASAAEIVNALNFGTNVILGTTGNIDMTNFDVVGSSGNITTAGDLALNGGDITSTSTTLTLGGSIVTLNCSDCIDFDDMEDILDLDTALTLNQTTNTWTQSFTGTTTTGLTYNANSLTSGTGLSLASTQGTTTGLFTGDLANLSLSKTYNGGAGSETGNILDVSRSITRDISVAGDLAVSGALATISDTAATTGAGTGTLTHSADVLRLAQNYTANTGSALNITSAGGATGFALRVNDDGTFTDSTPFVVDNSGNVGIGTTAPATTLHVRTPSGGQTARIDGGSSYPRLYFDSGDASILAVINRSTDDTAKDLYFGESADTGTYRFRSSGATTFEGNVGIGDTGPDAKLEVLGTTEQLRLTNVDGTTDARFTVSSTGDLTVDMLGSGTTDQLVLGDTDILNIGSGTASDVAYNLIADAADVKDEAAIAADNDLYVGGDVEIDGTLYAASVTATALAWDDLTAPTADLTLAHTTWNTVFNWVPVADTAETNFSMTTQGADAVAGGEVDQVLLALSQASNGVDTDQAADSLLTFANNDLNDPVTSAIRFDAGAAGTDFTYGINFDAATIGTAELILSNSATIGNTVDGTLALTEPTIQLVGSTAVDIDSPTIDLSTQTVDVTLNNAADSLNFDSNTLSIDALNNRVGIGTANPDTQFHVLGGAAGVDIFHFQRTSGASVDLIFDGSGGDARLQFIGNGGISEQFNIGVDQTDNAFKVNVGDNLLGTSDLLTIQTGGNVGIGTTTPDKKLAVWGGDGSIMDPTDLGSESLTNGALTGGTSWTATNDCSLVTNAATCTFAAGTASTVQQASGTLAVAGVGYRWYKFVYTVSAVSGTPTASITTAFASSSTSLTLTAGTQTTYFKAAASPGDFVITTTLTAGQAFTLDDLSLMEVQGGDLALGGILTGGGTTGLKVLANGNVGIGTTSPVNKVHVSGGTSGFYYTTTDYVTSTTGSGLQLITGSATGNTYSQLQAYTAGASAYGNIAIQPNGGSVGIGDTTPDAKLEVLGTTEQLRLTNVDDTTDARFTVSATGDLTIDMLGSGTTDQLVLGDTDTLNIGSGTASDVAYNLIADAADTKDEAAIAADNDLYIGGDLEVDGVIYGAVSGSAGSVKWNALTAPDGNLSPLAMGTNLTEFNWDTGTLTNDLFSFTTDASSNGTGSLVNIQTGTSSTVNPLRIRAGATESLFVDDNGNVGIGDITPSKAFVVGNGDLFQVDSSGHVKAPTLALGTGTIARTDRLFDINRSDAITNAVTYTGTMQRTLTGTLTGDISNDAGLYNYLTISATDDKYIHNTRGILTQTNLTDGNTIDAMNGVTSWIYNSSNTLSPFGNTATSSAAFSGSALNIGTGLVTNQYGGFFSSYITTNPGSITSSFGSSNQSYTNVDGSSIAFSYGTYGASYELAAQTTGGITTGYGGWFQGQDATNTYGLYAEGLQNTGNTETFADTYGSFSRCRANSATVTMTNCYGVYGDIDELVGTIATGYAGYFNSADALGTAYGVYANVTGASTTNYGVYSNVSGATTNYAGIFTGGNVGIGTTSPTYKLTVDGSVDGSDLVQMGGTGGSTGNLFRVYRNRASTGTDSPVVDIINDAAADDQTLFRLQQDAAADIVNIFDGASQVFTILDGGNVGIGDTTPASLLSVGNGDLFQVNSSGIIAAIDGVAHVIDDISGDLRLDSAGGGVLVGTGTPVALDMAGDDLFVTDDLEILGGVATMSAATNKIIGKALTVASTEMTTLTIGDTNTGDILLTPASNKYTLVQNNAGGAAAFQVDQLGSGDILTASAAGQTVFRLDTNGYAYYQRYTDIANSIYYLDPAATGTALNIAGDAVIGGGEVLFTPIASPTTTSEGNVYYDSDTNHLFVYTDYDGSAGWGRVAMDMTKYTTTNAAVANLSYVEVAHNQATNDIALTGWVYDTVTSLWKKISDYSHTIKQALQNEFDDASAKSFAINTNNTLMSNLVSYWTMNETSATAATQVTRSDTYGSNNLTDNRSATSYILSGTGKISNTADLELDNGNFFEVTDNGTVSTGDIDFTISAWVKLESESAGTTPEVIISKSDSATVREYSLYYTGATADKFKFELFDSGGTSQCNVSTTATDTVGTWYHLIAWHDATANTCNIVLNNGTADTAAETGVPADTAANFRVGADTTAESNFFDGLIDEVGFWKKTLTTQEKTDLYNSGNGNSYTTHGNLIRTETKDTNLQLASAINAGTGADGSIVIAANTDINAINSILGRSCADGGDAVNYSVTALTSTSATLSTTPSTGCINSGDEILLINLLGNSSITNLGNYETLKVNSVAGNVITFTTGKTKYYGDGASNDANIGTGAGAQRVMVQRVPNYKDVTVNSTFTFSPTAWNGTKGGVMFFRASGTVSIAGTISAAGKGYAGAASASGGGVAFCGTTGGGPGGGLGSAGTAGTCGGGGGGSASSTSGTYAGGNGSATGGGGGGGGYASDSSGANYARGGGGGGGGHVTFGYGGSSGGTSGQNGGTSTSGNGGAGVGIYLGGGGGGGGTYYDTDTTLTRLLMGSGGGGGANSYSWAGGNTYGYGGVGGNGGGIMQIEASNINVTGSVTGSGSAGAAGTGTYGGGGGGGAGGSVKLLGNTLSLGSSLVTAAAGSGGSGPASNSGGNGGSGAIAVYYATSYSGSTSPTAASTFSGYNTYGLYHSPVISTANAVTYESLRWETPVVPYGKVSFQTRSGATSSPTDGTWEVWKPFTLTTNYLDLNNADTHTDWTSANTLAVSEGDVTRNVDQFEDEDEATATNLAKLFSSGFQTDTAGTLTTSLTSFWPMNETSAVAGTPVTRNDTYSTNHLTDNRTATSYILSATGKVSNAADLELSNGNFFEKTDNADLSTGDIDFTISAWVKLESESAGTTQETIISKSDSATVREYSLYYTGATDDKFKFEIFDNDGTPGTSVCNVSTTATDTVGTWYHLIAWHDATANTCNIVLNNGAADSAAETGVAGDTAANFRIGATTTAEANFFDGLIDEAGFWKKTLSAAERTELYNSGGGNTYPTNGQYAQATITPKDISTYDYVTFWVRASQAGSSVKLGFGESAATEQEETVNIDAADIWQKVYWDISDVQSSQKDAVTKLRFTNMTSSTNTIYIDNIRAEKLLTDNNHSVVSSTPNNYFQYRVIMSTTNTAYQPQVENISLVYNDGFKIQQTDTNTVRLYNYTGATQNLRLDAIVFGADLAEWYAADDQSIEPGDVVSITGQNDEYSVPKIKKSALYADNNLMGIISTKAGLELGISGDDRRLVGLKGRVPVKIAPDSPRILSGDYLTSSSTYPGLATKLVTPGQAVAKALEPWDPNNPTDKINSFLNLSYHDPFDVAGIFNLVQLELLGEKMYSLYSIASDITGSYAKATIERAGAFSKLVAANLKAGLIETQEISTKIISPLPGEAIFIEGPVEIAGDASVSGNLVADRVITNELIADKVKVGTIEGLRQKIEDIVANLDQPTAPAPETDTIDVNTLNAIYQLLENQEATNSADYADLSFINAEGAYFSDYLAVLGQATITDLTITNSLSLANLTSPTGTIDLAGNFNVNGNLTVSGNVNILGELTAPTASFSSLLAQKLTAEKAKIDELTTNQLIIATDATASAEIASNSASIATNATAGKGVIPAGLSEYTIYSPHVDATSLVYVTPTGDPQNQVLYVKSKTVGGKFVVAINQALPYDLEFNWWIIKLE